MVTAQVDRLKVFRLKAGLSGHLVYLVYLVYSACLLYLLTQTNRINQTNQIDQMNKISLQPEPLSRYETC